MLDLQTVRAFLEVSKTGNMSLAAKNLYVTQSALSQRISFLENLVGQTLFVRKYKGMELNGAGKEFLTACQKLSQDFAAVSDWIDARRGIVKGHIKIITVSSFIDYVFPAFLKEFFKKYDDVKITIDVHTSQFIEESVLNGTHDLGIIVGPPKMKSLNAQEILDNKVYMVCSKDHPLAKKKKITDVDLKKTKIIWHSEKRSRTIQRLVKKLGLHSIDASGSLFLSSMESCKAYALQGLGVAFISNNHMKKELKQGQLVKLGGFELDCPAHLVTRKEQYQSTLIKTFVDEFVRYCERLEK